MAAWVGPRETHFPASRLGVLQVRVRLELKSPVKTIEDFLRKFSPSRVGSLATSKSNHKSASSFLSVLSSDSALFKLEEKLGPPSPAAASNSFSHGEDGWAPEPEPKPELRYEAESPDEAALVHAARAYHCALVDRLHEQVAVELPHLGRLTFELLHTLGFDSIRKRMSVVIRHPLTDEIYVYTKGADSVVMDLLLPCSSGTDTENVRPLWPPVGTAALFTVASLWQQPKCPAIDEWIKSCGTYVQWNITQPSKRVTSCHLGHHGWT